VRDVARSQWRMKAVNCERASAFGSGLKIGSLAFGASMRVLHGNRPFVKKGRRGFQNISPIVGRAGENRRNSLKTSRCEEDSHLPKLLPASKLMEKQSGSDMVKAANIKTYMDRVAARPKVQEALKAEGLH
jgi:hypothetical protein